MEAICLLNRCRLPQLQRQSFTAVWTGQYLEWQCVWCLCSLSASPSPRCSPTPPQTRRHFWREAPSTPPTAGPARATPSAPSLQGSLQWTDKNIPSIHWKCSGRASMPHYSYSSEAESSPMWNDHCEMKYLQNVALHLKRVPNSDSLASATFDQMRQFFMLHLLRL